jgi:hypothetical protein
MSRGVANNVYKTLRPDDALDDFEIEPGAGTPVNEEGEPEAEENVTITEDEDGGVTIEFGDPEAEAPALGFGGNIAERLTDTELEEIGRDLLELIRADDLTREEWKKAYDDGLKLLGLTTEERTEPFKGATGVIHPILNEAVVQFQSQAYKELLPAGGPVRTVVMGGTTTEKEEQATRVKTYMNYMVTEVMEEYDPDFDQMLYHLGFGGSTFKKVYYDEQLERATSPYILPKDLIVPYNARDLYTAERVTHVFVVTENSLKKSQESGFYRDVEITPKVTTVTKKEAEDKIKGIEPSTAEVEEIELYECHCNLFIEGYTPDDKGKNIKHPFVVTLDSSDGTVLSIRRNYRENDKKCRKKQYFVHYKFLPGFGFYGLGLVHLLGNVARSSTSALRQLVDAGTLSNLPGGFKTRGLRVANEGEAIQPGEWRDVDTASGDLSQSLFPLPYKEPSNTLFALLQFLIGAAEKFIGTSDLGMTDSNQEMPVGSVIALLERGSRVLSSVHKRMHYAQKQELKLLAEVIAEAMPDEYPIEFTGIDPKVKKADFDSKIDVLPVSDPNIFSMTQRISLAQEQLKLATASPQLHNMYEANRRMYVALGIPEIDTILPKPADPKAESPATEHAKLLALTSTAPLKAFMEQEHMLHIELHLEFYTMPMVTGQPPVVAALLQHIFEHVVMQAKVQVKQTIEKAAQEGDPNAAQMMQMLEQDPEMADPGFQKLIANAEKNLMAQIMPKLNPPQQGGDPLVELKKHEIAIKEKAVDTKAQVDQTKLQLEQQATAKQIEQKDKDLALKAQMHEDKMELETGKLEAARVDKTRDRAIEMEKMDRDEENKDKERKLKIATTVSSQLHQSGEKEKDRKAKPKAKSGE